MLYPTKFKPTIPTLKLVDRVSMSSHAKAYLSAHKNWGAVWNLNPYYLPGSQPGALTNYANCSIKTGAFRGT